MLERPASDSPDLFAQLRSVGLSAAEAGNLAARFEGLRAVPGGWTIRDVQRLRFARWLVASGRLGADDRVAASR